MSDKQLLGTGFAVLLIIVGILLVNKGKPLAPQPNINQKPVVNKAAEDLTIPAIAFEPGEVCGEVLEKCVARVEHRSSDCDRSDAKEEIERLLAKPLENVFCEDINKKLNEGCMTGCDLDLLALIRIPGGVEFEFDGQRNQLGECVAKGSRLVNVRGPCIGR